MQQKKRGGSGVINAARRAGVGEGGGCRQAGRQRVAAVCVAGAAGTREARTGRLA